MITGKDIAQIQSTRKLLQRLGRALEDEDHRTFDQGRLKETTHAAEVALFHVLNTAHIYGYVSRDDLFNE